MALYAFDGTWNKDEDAAEHDTNVVRFRDIYKDNGKVEYREGVGTRFGAIGRILGGILGMGGRSRIEEMYDAARTNWGGGDRTFDIIGFSRGAALAVHFANVLGEQGLRLTDGQTVKPEIRFLGLWDIVGSFGIPKDFIIKFQHINLGWTIDRLPNTVRRCFHAMALDERRETFMVTRLNPAGTISNIEELWFRGVHSDVGGGNGNVRRNNIALRWMLEKAHSCGLPIPGEKLALLDAESDPLASISENKDPQRDPRRATRQNDRYHPTAVAKGLGVGETTSFPVRAADKYNWAGVHVEEGAGYRFDVFGNQQWKDAGISCGADGWTSDRLPWYKKVVVTRFENSRRLPEANWFELVGALEDEDTDLFRIGVGCDYRATRDADLYAFANDLKTKYGNNTGQLTVTVRRVS